MCGTEGYLQKFLMLISFKNYNWSCVFDEAEIVLSLNGTSKKVNKSVHIQTCSVYIFTLLWHRQFKGCQAKTGKVRLDARVCPQPINANLTDSEGPGMPSSGRTDNTRLSVRSHCSPSNGSTIRRHRSPL